MSRSRSFALCLLAISTKLSAATFTVTTTADSGPGSLRQAILDANAAPGADDIHFFIPGNVLHTLAPASPLPDITDSVTIDGYSQAGSAPNTLDVGDNAAIAIEIDLENAGGPMRVVSDGNQQTTLRGLLVTGGWIIMTYASSDHPVGGTRVVGCFLGTSPDGSAASPHGGSGISIVSWSNTIGGPDAADRNLISGGGGVSIESSKQNMVSNNYIGTNAAGTAAIGNTDVGVRVQGGSPYFSTYNTISGNLISGNPAGGVKLSSHSDNSSVSNNVIGLDATGTDPIPNGLDGIQIAYATAVTVSANLVAFTAGHGISILGGGPYMLSGNTLFSNSGAGVSCGTNSFGTAISGGSIHDNGGSGVQYLASWPAKITGVTIFANGGLGIDVGADGSVTAGYPIVTSAFPDGSGNTVVRGTLTGPPNESVTVELFTNFSCDASGYGEGRTVVGSESVLTDGAGAATFETAVPLIADGLFVTATATSVGTTEFSNCVVVPTFPGFHVSGIGPRSGPAAGGTPVTVSGEAFAPGARVTIGGLDVGGIVLDDTQISVSAPALQPGTLSDVTVTNPGPAVATLPAEWLADFLDVPQHDPFHSAVESIVRAGITSGCGSGNYCPSSPVSREQIAVLLMRAEHGPAFLPPACTGVFADVPCSSPYADWIEELVTEGVSEGCGGGYFCPSEPVRRDQMAPLLLKSRYGSSYVPPVCIGTFADVPCPSMFAAWVEQLAAEGTTVGCGDGNYCPSAPVSRGQMAVFLVKTFPAP